MSDNEKCQNEGCGAWKDYLLGNCSRHIEKYIKTCPKYTTTPTTSIPVAELDHYKRLVKTGGEVIGVLQQELQALRDKIKELEADKERLDWLQNHATRLYFDDACGSMTYSDPKYFAKDDWLRIAIDKARK